jgi:hypothetical protein
MPERAILSLASNDSRDERALNYAGIQAMANKYKLQSAYAPKNSD